MDGDTIETSYYIKLIWTTKQLDQLSYLLARDHEVVSRHIITEIHEIELI